MHLHVSFSARIPGDLIGYLLRLALVVQVWIPPRARVFGHPLREVFFRLRGIYGHVALKGHVLHHPPGIRLRLGRLARVVGRLHRRHGFHRLHRRHGLHRLHRIFPDPGQGTRLDVALFDPSDNLPHPLVGRPRPRLDLAPGLLVRPTHLFVHPALGFLLSPLLLTYAHVASPTSPASSKAGRSCPRATKVFYARDADCLAFSMESSLIKGTARGFLVFGGLGGIGGLRGFLPSPSVAALRGMAAPPFSKLALAFIRTSLPASFARRARSTPRILETRARSSVSSTLSCQLISLRPPDELPDFRSRPERSTDPVVLSRGLPLVATRGDPVLLCGEGRELSS